MQRVLDCSEDAFQPLSNALKTKFLTPVFGGPISKEEADICTLQWVKEVLGYLTLPKWGNSTSTSPSKVLIYCHLL